jgi:hypothetical protein
MFLQFLEVSCIEVDAQGILTKEDFQWGVLNLLGQLEDSA